jgi:endonuclease G, mitochondrial
MKKLLFFWLFSLPIFGQVKNISNANLVDKDNFYLPKFSYTISYNDKLGHANWVGWQLQANDIGTNVYHGVFKSDVNLPDGFRIIHRKSYTKTAYDRGHLCNSQARSSSVSINAETYLMTNAVPQAVKCNRGTWKRLEDLCQQWALQGDYLTIYAGCLGRKGSLTKQGVNIPKQFWKVVLGHGPPVCMIFDNDESERFMTVDIQMIERLTGYKF